MTESAVPVPYVHPAGPKTIGQILDRTYRLTRAHFGSLVGIGAVPSALIVLAVAAMEAVLIAPTIAQWPQPPTPETLLRPYASAIFIPVFIALTLLCLAVSSIYMAAASHASTQADYGVKVTVRQAYELALNRGGLHVWLMVWIYLRAFLPILVVELAMFGGAALLMQGKTAPNPAVFLLFPLGILLLFAACVYSILVALRLSLAFPACVEEGLTARAAITRSSQLTQGAKGRIFLVMLVLYAILYAIILALELVAMLVAAIGFLAAAALQIHFTAPWSYIGIGVAAIFALALLVLITALTYAAMTTALAVLYHDQRLRKDGLVPAPQPAGMPA